MTDIEMVGVKGGGEVGGVKFHLLKCGAITEGR